MAWLRSLRTNGGVSAHERHRASGQPEVGNLFSSRGMMLAPVGSVASTVLRDLGEGEFSGKPSLGEVSGDSLLRLLRWNLRIQEHQHGWARSAKRGAQNAGISREFLERGQQRTKRRAIRLVDAVFKSRGEQIGTVLREGSKQQHRVLNVGNGVGARVLEGQHPAGLLGGEQGIRYRQ